MYLRLGLSFWSSCPYLSNAGNIDMFHLHLEWCLTEVIAVGIQVIRYKNHLMFLIDVFYYSFCVWALLSYVYVARRECCTFGADVTGSCKPLGMGSGTWTWSSRRTVRAGNYQGQISSLSPPPPPLFFKFSETGSGVAQAGLQLTVYLRMNLNSCSFCLFSQVLGSQACAPPDFYLRQDTLWSRLV